MLSSLMLSVTVLVNAGTLYFLANTFSLKGTSNTLAKRLWPPSQTHTTSPGGGTLSADNMFLSCGAHGVIIEESQTQA
jgi:hypothetical protein